MSISTMIHFTELGLRNWLVVINLSKYLSVDKHSTPLNPNIYQYINTKIIMNSKINILICFFIRFSTVDQIARYSLLI